VEESNANHETNTEYILLQQDNKIHKNSIKRKEHSKISAANSNLFKTLLSFVHKMDDIEEKPSLWARFKNKLKEYWRVLKIAKRPTREEYKTIVKVTGIGILVIGLLGFILTMLRELLVK
jgi:protein transport protein SEC61 subunit gamma and related proteins